MSEAGGEEPEQSGALHGEAYAAGRPGESGGSAAIVSLNARITPKALAPVPASPAPASPAEAAVVTFDQGELRQIFGLYGRKVAGGEWRDYALDFLRDRAIFSVYRRSSEVPLYRIEKTPRLARKQGQYAAVAASGLILKRGAELARVLAVLDRPLKIVR